MDYMFPESLDARPAGYTLARVAARASKNFIEILVDELS
jgi:hypothetical protein